MSVIQAIVLDKPCRCIDYRFCSPRLQNPEGFYCRLHGEPVPAASSACPICGGVSPHSHTSEQIAEHHIRSQARDCEHEWVDATDGRELRSFWRCRERHATFLGSQSDAAVAQEHFKGDTVPLKAPDTSGDEHGK